MRICQIVPSLEARRGGPSTSVRQLAIAQADSGHEVELLTTDAGIANAVQITEGACVMRSFRRTFPLRFCPSPSLDLHLRAQPADIIHHHALWLRTLHYAARTARRHQVPLVISPRGMMSPWAWRHHRWKKWLARALVHPGAFAAAAGWHATSEAEADDIRRLGFRQPVCVAPNGVTVPDDAANQTARAWWLEQCPFAADHPAALFYSRFHRKKRVLELLELWHRLSPPDWRLLIVGIPEEYTVAGLREHIARLGAQDRIFVHNGLSAPVPYPIASLFLLPSHSENFGLTIAEAMSHSVPALVTDTTPWSELNRRDLGWCVPWPAYADTLRSVLATPVTELRARGQAARDWVVQNYAWPHVAARLVDFYRQLSGPTA